MHEESRGVFACDTCGRIFKTENTMINHRKICTSSGERRRCERCGREVERTDLARHRRACTAREGGGGVRGEVRPEVNPRGQQRQNTRGCHRRRLNLGSRPGCTGLSGRTAPYATNDCRLQTWRGT